MCKGHNQFCGAIKLERQQQQQQLRLVSHFRSGWFESSTRKRKRSSMSLYYRCLVLRGLRMEYKKKKKKKAEQGTTRDPTFDEIVITVVITREKKKNKKTQHVMRLTGKADDTSKHTDRRETRKCELFALLVLSLPATSHARRAPAGTPCRTCSRSCSSDETH